MADKNGSRGWIEERGYPAPAVPSSALPPPPVKPAAPASQQPPASPATNPPR
jgi:hypothetical protein